MGNTPSFPLGLLTTAPPSPPPSLWPQDWLSWTPGLGCQLALTHHPYPQPATQQTAGRRPPTAQVWLMEHRPSPRVPLRAAAEPPGALQKAERHSS